MVTEAFACTPLEAYRQPVPVVRDVIDARAFRLAYRQVEEAAADEKLPQPSGSMVDAVMECQRESFNRVKEQRGH